MTKLEKKIHPLVTLPSVSGSVCVLDQENRQQARNSLSKIQRKDEDPNMFYEVNIESDPRNRNNEGELTTQCFNANKEIFKVAKAALTMNILTLFFFVTLVPNRILDIIYQNCFEVSQECGYYVLLYKISSPVRIFCAFLHPVLILKKMDYI